MYQWFTRKYLLVCLEHITPEGIVGDLPCDVYNTSVYSTSTECNFVYLVTLIRHVHKYMHDRVALYY